MSPATRLALTVLAALLAAAITVAVAARAGPTGAVGVALPLILLAAAALIRWRRP